MSTGPAQVAVLARPGYRPSSRPRDAGARTAHFRLGAFGALALFGVLRWSSLFSHGGTVRLLGLLVLAVLLVGARAPLAERSRLLAALFTALVLVATLPLAGLPLAWLWHLRIAVTVRAIGDGLSALPGISIPYDGNDQWVRLDIVLGAAILLFDAALLLAFAPRAIEDLRCVGVALPLVALTAVPFTAVHSRLPYVEGALLFALLAAFIWADRVGHRQAAGAFLVCGLAGIVALVAAPAVDRHRGWIDYEALAGSLAPKAVDSFDWSQRYGPVTWPRRGRTVLDIEAARPEYWKTEDLDVFDGRGWTQGIVPGDQNTPRPARASLAEWTQTIQVNVRDMRSADVIGSGISARPVGLAHAVLNGFSAGTWTATADLAPGDSYTVVTYAPEPTPAQLSAAGTGYGGLPAGYRTILLPASTLSGSSAAPQIVFPPFHSKQPVESVVGLPIGAGSGVVDRSPYAGVYRVARRLARGAATPYAFVASVERILAHGYAYSENPPLRSYPLAGFLLADRRGYCQQFAGAMALLLRMGGVPARVSVGFTQGRQSGTTNQWLVTDSDAHAWVEAWFPRYGWIRFDPTPPLDPALGGRAPIQSISSNPSYKTSLQVARGATTHPAARGHPRARKADGSAGGDPEMLAATFGVLGLVLVSLMLFATRPLTSAEALVGELERALGRSGRPLGAGATLAGIERRMSAGAAEYVRALRLARFGGRHELPTARQRRALRRQLAIRRGAWSALRALWALPPRRRPRGPIRAAGSRAGHAPGPPEA